ncbi:MAG: hypothetical protein ACI9NQ_000854 [Paracoccaceae bacterium]|jgi:uncharacterized protein (DUF1501 family)
MAMNATGIISGNGDGQRTLVVVFLRGGADGLTLVPPVGDQGYHDARPTLAVAEKEILKLGESNCGLNPALSSLYNIYRDGGLSVVPGVGSNDDTRSHFYAQDLMEHGGPVAGGWLGRFLRYRDGLPPTALSAIALGKAMPEVLRGAPAATVMESMDTFSLGQGSASTDKLKTELGTLYAADESILGPAARDTLQALDRIEDLRSEDLPPENGAEYGDSRFEGGLRQAARLIRARVGLEAVSLDLDGWDSHFAQETLVTPLMTRLSDGLAAFYRDLGKQMESVTVVVMTEFGRRVAENSSFGTDHGRGGAMLVMGGAERGNVLGTMPDLETGILVGPGDVPVVTDYRDVLKPILKQHGAVKSMAEIFPEH